MKGFEATKEFREWAIGFSGCDGGDLAQNGIWFCGIEWGGGFTEEEKDEIFKVYPNKLSPISELDFQKDLKKYQFNVKWQSYIQF